MLVFGLPGAEQPAQPAGCATAAWGRGRWRRVLRQDALNPGRERIRQVLTVLLHGE